MSGENIGGSGLEEATAAFIDELTPSQIKSTPKLKGSEGPTERLFQGRELPTNYDRKGSKENEDSEEQDDGVSGADDSQDEPRKRRRPDVPDAPDESSEDVDGEEDEDEDNDAEGTDNDGDEDDAESEGESSEVNLKQEFLVNVEGEPTTVTLKEALDGYIRTETFHRRLNHVNEAKKVLEEERTAVSHSRAKYTENLTALITQLKAIEPREPTQAEWDASYAADPAAAREREKAWNTYKQQRQAVEEEKKRVDNETHEDDVKRLKEWVTAERFKMLQENPGWKDEKIRNVDFARMRKTAKESGFSDEEVDQLYDSRMVKILNKAAKYDRMMASKPRHVDKGALPAQPGTGNSSKKTVHKGNQAMRRLARTGSIQDAAKFFEKLV
jgi:hypothetical protein